MSRWAWVEIDHEAIAHNVQVVRRRVAPAAVWAVVKADGYGHGAVEVARTALGAGAAGLCVALVQEGAELREAGIHAPILLLSPQPIEQSAHMVSASLLPTLASAEAVDALADAVLGSGCPQPFDVHVKIDTGMHRAGADPTAAIAVVEAIAARPELRLDGVFTHLAMADEPAAPANAVQLQRFAAVLDSLRRAGHEVPRVHMANSAAALAIPPARGDLVRLGIAMYGIEPGSGVATQCAELRPALTLRARVGSVRSVAAGEGVSYGLRHRFAHDTVIATIPLGYADGVPRRLFETGGEVLIGGRRLPIVGVVTMDQLMVDCGDLPVAIGDDVVLIGAQGDRPPGTMIRAEEWAERLGTIGYEIVCGISKRIERRPQRPASTDRQPRTDSRPRLHPTTSPAST